MGTDPGNSVALQHLCELTILVRGAGEMASGTAWRLHKCGFSRILMTEIPEPLTVRRTVSFSEAVHAGTMTVEGVTAVKIGRASDAYAAWEQRTIAVVVDPSNESRHSIKPQVIVDAIMAKKNTGTSISDAPIVIALGPGFHAGQDVHHVVETNRGHDLGRVISAGSAQPDTGVPGTIGGEGSRRVVRSPAAGRFDSTIEIGTLVRAGQRLGQVAGQEVRAEIDGVLRGLIRQGTTVCQGMKIGDVDPRAVKSYCYTISDKARSIAGGVVEAVLMTLDSGKNTSSIALIINKPDY